jgi:hypothetical protein
VGAHTERKWNDKFGIKNSKIQNIHENIKLIHGKASEHLD